MADFFAFFVVLFLCFILNLIFFPVISSFQDVSGWKLRKIMRNLKQVQKGNSYLLEELWFSVSMLFYPDFPGLHPVSCHAEKKHHLFQPDQRQISQTGT